MRWGIILQYNGKNYHGWQRQGNDTPTIQGVLCKYFSDVLQEEILVLGCGRTDSGVHAKNYVAYFDSVNLTHDKVDWLLWKINAYLPFDIRINHIVKVPEEFNARFDALSRTYRYYITTVKQPFNYDFSWFIPQKLNIQKMNTAARMMYQYDDFTSLSKVNEQTPTNICRVLYAHWEKRGEMWSALFDAFGSLDITKVQQISGIAGTYRFGRAYFAMEPEMRAIFRQIFNKIIETASQSLSLTLSNRAAPYQDLPEYNDSKRGPIFFDAYDIVQEGQEDQGKTESAENKENKTNTNDANLGKIKE